MDTAEIEIGEQLIRDFLAQYNSTQYFGVFIWRARESSANISNLPLPTASRAREVTIIEPEIVEDETRSVDEQREAMGIRH